MEIKKSPKADLEGKRSTWLLIGYVITLAVMFVAFEWSERDVQIDMSQGVADVVFEEEIIPITEQEQPEEVTPPPVEAPPVQMTEEFTIVDDDTEVQEVNIASSEELGQQVEIKYVPQEIEEEEPEEQTIFEVVEEAPEFPGGICQFVVNRDGTIVDVKVIRGVDAYLDKEAVRVIQSMPKWKPGKQRGKAVRVRYTLPVMFRLQ